MALDARRVASRDDMRGLVNSPGAALKLRRKDTKSAGGDT
jgi:hypothetical protein